MDTGYEPNFFRFIDIVIFEYRNHLPSGINLGYLRPTNNYITIGECFLQSTPTVV